MYVTSFKKRLRIVVINSQVNVSTSWFSLNSLEDLFAIGIWKQSIELFMFVYLCARKLTFFSCGWCNIRPQCSVKGLLSLKYKRLKKIAWIKSHHLHLQWKFKLLEGKFTWRIEAKHCRVMSTNFLFLKISRQCPVIFCFYTSSKLSHSWFEFSLKVKVMGFNPGYLLTSFLL